MNGPVSKMSYVLSFVIINYFNYNVTIDCVDSLLKNDLSKSVIVIVENGSSNESFDELLKKYGSENKVHILKSTVNTGYSGGCNMGIDYSKKVLHAENVALLNSDLLFNDVDIVSNMIKKISNVNCGVINIKLLNKDGSTQIPYGRFSSNVLYEFIRVYVYLLINFFKNIFHLKRKEKDFKDIKNKKYIINGPAFCLTTIFFDKYNYLFEKNFLYMEEFNLYVYLKKAKLTSKTYDFGKVVHLENQSDLMCKNVSNKKLRKIFISSFKSYYIFFKSSKKIKNKYSKIKGNYEIYDSNVIKD